MLTLNGEYEITSPRDFAPVPSKIIQNKETFPTYLNTKTGEMFTCIFWAADRYTGYEYYGFEKVKGSFKNKKSIVYRGWKMEVTSFASEFPRAMFSDTDRYHVVDNPQELGSSVLPPQYRTINGLVEDSIQWKRLNPPFF